MQPVRLLMRYTTKIKQAVRYLILVVLSICLVLITGYFIPTKWNSNSQKNCNVNIYIYSSDIHSDIVVPVKTEVFDWKNYLSLKTVGTESFTNYNYLIFGWGDRDFFTKTRSWADFKLSIALKALFFLNNPSVMHVQGYSFLPKNKYFSIKCIRISNKDYLKLVKFINDSFQTDDRGNKIRVANGYYDYDGFYAAKGSYSLWRDCNAWTAEALRLADVNTPLWAALSSAIMLHVKSDCECL